MTLASPLLYVIGGICIGWTIPAFGRHHFFGWMMLVIAGASLTAAALGSTVTIPRITVHPKPASSSAAATPGPSSTG